MATNESQSVNQIDLLSWADRLSSERKAQLADVLIDMQAPTYRNNDSTPGHTNLNSDEDRPVAERNDG